MGDRREFVIVGLALLGAGGLLALHNNSVAPKPAPTPTPTPTPIPPVLPGPTGGKIPGSSAAPPAAAPPRSSLQSILDKVQASGPFYTVWWAANGSSSPLLTTNVLIDAVNKAKSGACGTFVTRSAGPGPAKPTDPKVFTTQCGIATRRLSAPPTPASAPRPRAIQTVGPDQYSSPRRAGGPQAIV